MLKKEKTGAVVGRKVEINIWIGFKFIQRHPNFAHD